jgi:hypothetical protein
MNADTIGFMKLMRQRVNPEELFEDVLDETTRALDEQLHVAMDEHIHNQEQLEQKVTGLMAAVAASDVAHAAQVQVKDGCTKKLDAIKAVQPEMQRNLTEKKTELQMRQQNAMFLAHNLASLKQDVTNLPPHGETFLLEFGRRACQNISQTNNRSTHNVSFSSRPNRF